MQNIGILKLLLGHEKLDALNEREWSNLYDHIEIHKHFMDADRHSLSWHDAFHSWYRNVYSPVQNITRSSWYSRAFPQFSSFQRCLNLLKHWQYMKMFTPNISVQLAGRTSIARYGSGAIATCMRVYLFFKYGLKKNLLNYD